MKKLLKKIALTLTFLFCSNTISSFAISLESVKSKDTEKTVSVYDGSGNLLYDKIQMSEYNKLKETKGIGVLLVVKVFFKALGVLGSISFVTEVLTGVSIPRWIHDNITIPIYNTSKTMEIYSRDRNVFNPYPPRSYQGATWKKNNFYVVVFN
ncbi:MAG: hypothetical protein ACRC30_02995 [Clostridium sp.]